MTATVEDVVAHVRELGRVDGLINNTHLGEETTVELVQEGARLVTAAARLLGLPVVATSVVKELAPLLGGRDVMGNPVRVLERFMPRAFW
jgi:NAD(P)-dependent dehydrogenase (short-subunit alcohol dehydrogenase family)